jgi:hypothetical protein
LLGILAALLLLAWPGGAASAPAPEDVCADISRASVIADDGTYLGKVENPYASESILNEYGSYGSQYASRSIWNEYGQYGGKFSSKSPFNPYTSTPPKLVKRGEAIGFLTVNQSLKPAVNPNYVKTCDY